MISFKSCKKITPVWICYFQDNRNFVDQSLFYKCCPYVGEIKTLLVDFTVGSSSKVSNVRKITPISADIPVQKSLTDRQLQVNMLLSYAHNYFLHKYFRSSLFHQFIITIHPEIFHYNNRLTFGSLTYLDK
jgi:hypothetical protein